MGTPTFTISRKAAPGAFDPQEFYRKEYAKDGKRQNSGSGARVCA